MSGKSSQRLHGVALTDLGQAAPVGGLQGLHNQFDLANAARAKLHVPSNVPAARHLFINLSLHLEDVLDGVGAERSGKNESFRHFQKSTTESTITCDGPGLDQREAFPGCEPLFVIPPVTAERVREVSSLAFRPEAKVDTIDIP